MKEKLKDKKVVYTIIGIISILLIVIGITYAYWLVTKTQTNSNVISSACLDITLSDEANDISLTNQFPLSDEDGMSLMPYTFTVINNCSTSVDYQVNLESIGDESTAISTSSIKAALNDNIKLLTSGGNTETTISGAYEANSLTYGTLAPSGNDGSSVSYSLRLWIDEDAPISEMNKTYTGKISVTIGQGIVNPYQEGTLAYSILSNNNGVTEIDANEYGHRVVETTSYNELEKSYYFGTSYSYDKETEVYTLDGTITQATFYECMKGKESDGTAITCGKYTLRETTENAKSKYLYEVESFGRSYSDYDGGTQYDYPIMNTIQYKTTFESITSASEAGLYKTSDDLGDTYYFRGAPTNNYVKFGKHTTPVVEEYTEIITKYRYYASWSETKYSYEYSWTTYFYEYEVCDEEANNGEGSCWYTGDGSSFETQEACESALLNNGYSGYCQESYEGDSGYGFSTLEACESELQDKGYSDVKCYSYEESGDVYSDGSFETQEACEADLEAKGYSGFCYGYEETETKQSESTDMYWRIVRINGDGTIRLVYDGARKVANGTDHTATIAATAYNTNYLDEKYTGYTYSDGTKEVDSTIKGVVDKWYVDNLKTNYGKYIADSIFCNDRELAGYEYFADGEPVGTAEEATLFYKYFGAHSRLYDNKTPSLKCNQKSDRYTISEDKGNGLLTNPVGLITADEVAMAGGVNGLKNYNYYLYSGKHYFTMSPKYYMDYSGDIGVGVWLVGDKYPSGLSEWCVDCSSNVRPVINLKADVEFTGSGTIDTPYEIVTE